MKEQQSLKNGCSFHGFIKCCHYNSSIQSSRTLPMIIPHNPSRKLGGKNSTRPRACLRVSSSSGNEPRNMFELKAFVGNHARELNEKRQSVGYIFRNSFAKRPNGQHPDSQIREKPLIAH